MKYKSFLYVFKINNIFCAVKLLKKFYLVKFFLLDLFWSRLNGSLTLCKIHKHTHTTAHTSQCVVLIELESGLAEWEQEGWCSDGAMLPVSLTLPLLCLSHSLSHTLKDANSLSVINTQRHTLAKHWGISSWLCLVNVIWRTSSVWKAGIKQGLTTAWVHLPDSSNHT